jgi:hypothetical protein
MPDDDWWQPKHVVFLENKVKKYKERCVKSNLYFIFNDVKVAIPVQT